MSKGSSLSTNEKNEIKATASAELTAATAAYAAVNKSDAAAKFKAQRRLDRAREKNRQAALVE